MNETGIDYNSCSFSPLEWLKHCVLGLSYFFIMGLIFYQNIWLSLLASVGVVFYIKEQQQINIRRRKETLLLQFREGMYALGSSLSAGRAVEQAFVQSLGDLRIIYEEEMDLIVEWQLIIKRISMNEPVEAALLDFADRADIEDIYNFVSVFVMAKRSGGDLVHIIKDTTKIINEKLEIQKEIDVLITQKKFEQKILSYIIPGMILFFTVASPNFLEPLYAGVQGRVIMTVALGLYMISATMGKKIVRIEV